MIELHRDTSPGPVPGSGTWKRAVVDDEPTANVGCPRCSFRAPLAGTHVIDKNGAVEPSLQCGNEACGFHEVIRLVGWVG